MQCQETHSLRFLLGDCQLLKERIILQNRWNKPPSWWWGNLFRKQEKLWELRKTWNKWYCGVCWFVCFSKMFSQNILYKFHWAYFTEHPKPQISSIQVENAANSLFVKGRVLALPQGNEFSHYKVRMDLVLDGIWSGDKGFPHGVLTISMQSTCASFWWIVKVIVSQKVQRPVSFIYPSQKIEEKQDGIKKNKQNQIKTKTNKQKAQQNQ